MGIEIKKVLVPGEARGQVLSVAPPLSFWGGIDPVTGKIIDPRHPLVDTSIQQKIIFMDRIIGSSSGSSVMLELMKRKSAPAAVVLRQADAILSLGVIVGRAMNYGTLPVVIAEFDSWSLPSEFYLNVL